MDLIWVVAGTALIGLAVADVWRTVLHADADGTVAKLVRRAGWRLATLVGAWLPGRADPTLQLPAAALSSAVARLQQTVAEGYLPPGVTRRLVAPVPAPSDHEVVARLRRRLVGSSPRGVGVDGSPAGPEAAIAVYRARVFLAALRRWTRYDLAGYEWEDGHQPGRSGGAGATGLRRRSGRRWRRRLG